MICDRDPRFAQSSQSLPFVGPLETTPTLLEDAGQSEETGHSGEGLTVQPQEILEELQEEAELPEVSVPCWFPGQEKFKWGGCKYHCQLSLQPHLTRSGNSHDFGKLFLRCSSWFKNCPAAEKCWYRADFPRGLFKKLPQNIQDEYTSLRMAFAQGR